MARDSNGNYLDFNLDGNPDLAVSNSVGNYVTVMLGDGAGGFKVQVQAKYGNKSTHPSVGAADVNSDGKVDLVLANDNGDYITVLLGNGNGTFSKPYNFKIADLRARQPSAIAFGDFNNDGGVDIAIANGDSNNVSVLLKNLMI